MQAFIALRRRFQTSIHLNRGSRKASRETVAAVAGVVHMDISLLVDRLCSRWWTTGGVEMDNSGFQKMVVDLVEVDNRPDDMCSNISFIAQGVQPTPDSHVTVLSDVLLLQRLVVIVPIVPDLDFDGSSAVIQFVCYVCGLLRDVSDLGNECTLLMLIGQKASWGNSYLRNVHIVYLEVFLTDLLCFIQLFDRNRPKTIVSERLTARSATRKLVQSLDSIPCSCLGLPGFLQS